MMADEPLFVPEATVVPPPRPLKRSAPRDVEPLWEEGDLPMPTRRRLRTGGPIAWLNCHLSLNSRANSVATSTITKAHRPDTGEAMAAQIASHVKRPDGARPCDKCTAVAQGTVQDFGRRLFRCQSWKPYCAYLESISAQPATLERCQEYCWDLFAVRCVRAGKHVKCARECARPRLLSRSGVYVAVPRGDARQSCLRRLPCKSRWMLHPSRAATACRRHPRRTTLASRWIWW